MAFLKTSHFLLDFLFAGCTWLLFGGGLLVAFAGFWALQKEFYLSKYGLITPGMVITIDSRRKRTRKGGYVTIYDAVVTFQMLDAADPVTFVASTGSFNIYQTEQQVRVIYLPEDLKSARIDDRMRWLGPWLGICFGLCFATLTVIMSMPTITITH